MTRFIDCDDGWKDPRLECALPYRRNGYPNKRCHYSDRTIETMLRKKVIPLAFTILLHALPASAQQTANRDEFYWLGEINKATAVINSQEGLLDKPLVSGIAAGLAKVIHDGNQPGGKRPSTVITFEPLLIQAAGMDVTLLHAGRSSQDMHATYRAAILRDDMLRLAEQLNKTSATLVTLAQKHERTIVPNYTNGVAAQPNSYGHYLLGYAAALDRDAQRIREAYARIDLCPMGTTVLNGTSWPLDRVRMAQYLGFADIATTPTTRIRSPRSIIRWTSARS